MVQSNFNKLKEVTKKGLRFSEVIFHDYAYDRIVEIVQTRKLVDDFRAFVSFLSQILRQQSQLDAIPSLTFLEEELEGVDDQKWRNYGLHLNRNKGYINISLDPNNRYVSDLEDKLFALLQTKDDTEPVDKINSFEWLEQKTVRRDFSIPLDKFIAEKSKKLSGNYRSYVSNAQRRALISILTMERGTTLVINLPTGGGKSLLFQSQLFLSEEKKLVLVVVPTTSLALDQERRIHELGIEKIKPNHPMAFHSGLSQERRELIRNNIRSGSQGILFVSPEAVVGSLRPALYDAAESDLISHIFIDEAHVISGWGNTFRDSFQALPAIRKGLLSVAKDKPFKTVLLSATFTKTDLDLFDVLFGPRDKVSFFSWVYMRPEPKYHFYKVLDQQAKFEFCEYLVDLVPKPLIIYTTLKRDANIIANLVKKKFVNTEVFTGDTSPKDRDILIKKWSLGEIDVIVGNSAFGVGIDKENVRSVIHATIPETVERFYQEVGRGGRDGRASNSIVVFCEEDKLVAKNTIIGNPGDLIGWKLALYRWKDMFERNYKNREGKAHIINTYDTIHENANQQTEKSKYHNQQIIYVMARAGMIEIQSRKPNIDIDMIVSDNDREQFWMNYYREIPVVIIDERHLDPSNFKLKFSEASPRLLNSQKKSNKVLVDLLEGKLTIEKALLDIYQSEKKCRKIKLEKASRGCPKSPKGTGTEIKGKVFYREPVINDFSNQKNAGFLFLKTWANIFKEKHPNVLYYNIDDPLNAASKIAQFIKIMTIKYDVSQINLCKSLKKNKEFIELEEEFSKKNYPFFVNYLDFGNLQKDKKKLASVSTITVLMPWDDKYMPEYFEEMDGVNLPNFPFHILIAPDNIFCNIFRKERVLLNHEYGKPVYVDKVVDTEQK